MRETTEITACYHCGEDCVEIIHHDEHDFCCNGCKTVYSLLKDTGLSNYYNIESNPGQTQKAESENLEFLDLDDVREKLIDFTEGNHNKITLYLPAIHCAACIWLLEKLNKIEKGVIRSDVTYIRKEITILFDAEIISLKELVILLEKLGYSPDLQRKGAETKGKKIENALMVKLGLSWICIWQNHAIQFPRVLEYW